MNVQEVRYHIDEDFGEGCVSPRAINFIEQLLVRDVRYPYLQYNLSPLQSDINSALLDNSSNRLTSEEAMHHPWINVGLNINIVVVVCVITVCYVAITIQAQRTEDGYHPNSPPS